VSFHPHFDQYRFAADFIPSTGSGHRSINHSFQRYLRPAFFEKEVGRRFRRNNRFAQILSASIILFSAICVPHFLHKRKRRRKMILLQIYFTEEKAGAFEAMFADAYVPAMKKQTGYLGSTLLRLFPAAITQEIGAADTPFNYQMELRFDTEANRRLWAASDEHAVVWPLAQAMSSAVAWRGSDVVG
jgi:hypothetical protein